MSPVNAVSMKNIWVRYGDTIVLENINLTVIQGEIVSIVGPNGSGKSTLLRTIIGAKDPFRGEIHVLGQHPKKIQRQGLIGYLPQMAHYDADFPIRVYDLVAMSRYAGKGLVERLRAKDRRLIHQALEKVEMSQHCDTHFGSLSGGQRQRVRIARALAARPGLLVLDEPSTGLDTVAQDNFFHLLMKLRDEETLTIIMVSHDVGAVCPIADKIACLNRKIHFHGKSSECVPSEALEKVFGKDIQFLFHDQHCETCRED